jgi:hypothetical protein
MAIAWVAVVRKDMVAGTIMARVVRVLLIRRSENSDDRAQRK